MTSHDRHDRDRGITLTELLITITIMGIVTTVLSGAIVMFLRSQDSAPRRVDESRALQQLVNYLPADVGSAQDLRTGPPWISLCGDTGTPVLNLRWSESFPGVSTGEIVVTYRRSADGTQLVRSRCQDGSSDSVVVARRMDDVSAVIRDAASTQVVMTVAFDSNTHVITAHSRNR